MTKLRVLHNDTCPICSREVAGYDRLARKTGVALDIHGLDAAPGWGLDRDTAAQSFRVEWAGERHEGLDAFRVLWARLPGWRWLAWITGLPGVHWLADRAYRNAAAPLLYAMHRRRQSRQPDAPSS
jgi:predicted DCC family thiol-disulfide oxidoreductase YuxK